MKKVKLRLYLILFYSFCYFSVYSQSFEIFVDGSDQPSNIKDKTSIDLKSKPNKIIIIGKDLKDKVDYNLKNANVTLANINIEKPKSEEVDLKNLDFSKTQTFQIVIDKQTIVTFSIKVEKTEIPETCNCNTIKFNKNDLECKTLRTLENNFGEDPTTYDEDKIVYIYDFNKDVNKRGFYKVVRNKDKDRGLEIFKDIKTTKFGIKEDTLIFKNTNRTQSKVTKQLDSLNKKLESLKMDSAKYEHKNTVDKMPIYSLITTPVNFSKEILKSTNHVQFKVVNINRFLYNVSIEDSIVQFDSQPPSLLDQIFIGDTTLREKVETAFKDNFIRKSGSSKNTTENKNAQNSLLCKIKCFAENYSSLNAKMLEAYNPCSDFPCCQKLIPAYEQLVKDLFEIKLDSATTQQTLIKNLNTELTNSKAIQSACNQKKEKLAKLQRDTEIIKAKKEADLTIKDKENLASFSEDEKKLKAELCSDSLVTSIEKQIKDLENKIKINNTISELSKSLPTEIQIKKAIVFIQHMIDMNKTYMQERVSLNGNQLELKLRISSKDSITKYFSIPDYKNKEIPFVIPIKGRPFISFSSGSYVIVDNSLVNKTYDWQPMPNNSGLIGKDSARYILTESGYSAPMMGFAALANAEIKFSRFIGVGLSTGVGLTIETKPRLAYLLGISGFLGELRQFALTVGWAITQVDKLNNNLLSAYNDKISYTASARQDIKYYQEAKGGFFVSISYTPFKAAKSR